MDPDVIVVAAGMDGVLPGIVAGLMAVPVIGLPVSTGYGEGGAGRGRSPPCSSRAREA